MDREIGTIKHPPPAFERFVMEIVQFRSHLKTEGPRLPNYISQLVYFQIAKFLNVQVISSALDWYS